ncbi:hypothetical protein ONE63_003465 [Megalurothrips usitatus]|uniref:Uncharacterized protein n=1 Tax=Megalurothrips usitatus TaxID=439358 RepID=A0AAV7X7C8_9NEOP|nr:hypothetical protein ONE63_003465 [Megalurothrips usitatus]
MSLLSDRIVEEVAVSFRVVVTNETAGPAVELIDLVSSSSSDDSGATLEQAALDAPVAAHETVPVNDPVDAPVFNVEVEEFGEMTPQTMDGNVEIFVHFFQRGAPCHPRIGQHLPFLLYLSARVWRCCFY